jgi:hypothetical protein
MSNCIKEERFLFWKYKVVRHKYDIIGINKFMYSSDTFHVHYKCKNCGLSKSDSFIEPDTLILNGIAPEILNEVGTDWFSIKQTK